MSFNREFLDTIKEALEAYTAEVEDTDRGRVAKESYIYHAEAFTRWLGGDFDPGKEWLQ